jgi:predicted dehydrogenase
MAFDLDVSGVGAVAGDLGSNWAYLARSFFGDIEAVTAVFGQSVRRGARPDAGDYPRGEDSAMILLQFENGATGSLHVSAVAYEPAESGSDTRCGAAWLGRHAPPRLRLERRATRR